MMILSVGSARNNFRAVPAVWTSKQQQLYKYVTEMTGKYVCETCPLLCSRYDVVRLLITCQNDIGTTATEK
jgi:hypothetical protein